jgi:MraZ protein
LVFTGTYEHSIDAKHRLAIPSDIRAQIQQESGQPAAAPEGQLPGAVYLYVTLGEGNCLAIYTEQGFDQRARELDQSELDADQILEYERVMFSLSRRVELDQQGRVRLPENLLAMTGLKNDVVLLGVKDHLEIRDREAWNAHVKRLLVEQPQILKNPRRMMKRPPGSGPASGSLPGNVA